VRGLGAPDPTGVLFESQTTEAIVAAVRTFVQMGEQMSRDACRANALRFAPEHFRAGVARAIERMCTGTQPVASPVPS